MYVCNRLNILKSLLPLPQLYFFQKHFCDTFTVKNGCQFTRYLLGWVDRLVDFINVLTLSFYIYACRSQKHKNLLGITVIFALSGFVYVKAAHKMLVKLTPGCHSQDPIQQVVLVEGCQPGQASYVLIAGLLGQCFSTFFPSRHPCSSI